jgi:glycosyltransferase involved in cell wall biosynthesis
VAVVIPTRSRPDRLLRCLESLAPAQGRLGFPVYVCDSSPGEDDRRAVGDIAERFEWVRLNRHEGRNIAAARNACVRAAEEELLVDIDDDLELEPEAVDRLLERYMETSGRRIVAGSVSWDGTWTTPVKKRAIGYGRPALEGEAPDFVVGAFFAYPRAFALAWPWNERIDVTDDIFMGALWRSHGVQLLFAENARALHPDLPMSFDASRMDETVKHQKCHIYSLLFDSMIANPSLRRTLSYEILGFAASARLYLPRPRLLLPFLRGWIEGHLRLIADSRYLWALVHKELPDGT